VISLLDVLLTAGEFPGDTRLFLPLDVVWNLEMPCAVLPVDPYAETDAAPELARKNGLRYALQMPQVQDVVANARLQREKLTPEMLLRAFLFYYDRDAFIDFDAESGRG
jgi:hypothetical protein